jgi:quercetin dioxygenase-like cupin family protein
VRGIATVSTIVLVVFSAALLAVQSAATGPEWEMLVGKPLPDDGEPMLSVNGLTMPAQPVGEHSHAGPVVGYILQGEIENQVEPEPPAIHKAGSFFYERPRHVHRIMRNLSAEPATLLLYHLSEKRTEP